MGEDFPVVKTYGRADGPEASIVLGKPIDVEAHSPFDRGAWERVFQMGDVKVRKLGKRTCAKIHGKIYLQHPDGLWTLYDREEKEAETVDLPGVITLTPPPFGIMSYDPISIKFDMASGLEGMNKRIISWMPHSPHDEVRKVRVKGRRWGTEVSFSVFDSAVLADMKIDLLNRINREEEEIYGSITASFTDKMFASLEPLYLFNRKPIDPLHVKAEEYLPLSRPFIAVPYNNALNINVNLRTVSGTPIAGGIISIRPESLGWWFGILGGKDDGMIQVRAKVDFCAFHEHPPTRSVCHPVYDSDSDSGVDRDEWIKFLSQEVSD